MSLLSMSVNEYVATITLNNQPANAMSSHVLKELLPLLESVENDESVRVVLIRGEGRFFSAGADIKEFTSIETKEEAYEVAKNGQQLFERVESFAKPIIAVIHGAALGGGLEFAMSCHMRIVSETAKLGLPELNLGIIPGFAGTQRLPRYVGTSKALEMMLTGEPITGAEAFACGLATRCCKEETLFEEALAVAKKMAAKSPLSVQAVMKLIHTSKTEAFHTGVEKEAVIFGDVFTSADAREGVAAFIEKRKPVFTGK
ncbi:enoyl-CoA hydratase [Priestia taiwanensis]|uniref:Enoyl-CoA hydratase n=1 Tax=Priestia taiwanensis TaxID=1347902 RepID=A0A917AUY8_9BACI|nr:enoyl-CoA hydratase [Priestia taiwanensis]MBM7363520.1 enoyl-CoA hydratase [Priestia taiwanensis]GGE76457.1 enoyl-CoA hydratase [Priestia taiwanensis]